MTRSKGKRRVELRHLLAPPRYCGRSPVPLSPIAANFSESGRLGSGEDCARSAARTRRRRRRETARSAGDVTRWHGRLRRTIHRVYAAGHVGLVGTVIAARSRWMPTVRSAAQTLARRWLVGWPQALAVVSAQEPATRAEADKQRARRRSRTPRAVQAGRLRARDALRRGEGHLHPRPRGALSEARLAHDRQRLRLRRRLSRSRSVRQQGHARSCGPRRARRRTGRPRRGSRFRSWRTSGCWSRPGPRTATTRRRISSASAPTRRATTRPATPSDRTSFGGRAGVRPLRSCSLGGGLEYLNPRLGHGKDSRVPSIEQRLRSVDGAGPRRIGRLPALDGLSGGRLSRAEERAQGRVVSRRPLALRRSHHRPVSRSTASTPTCVSSSASSPGGA